jgi:hypothetical protein
MKKLFLIGIIFACSIGLGTAADTGDQAVQICWENSCGQMHCGAYYLSDSIRDLLDDVATSEKDCETESETNHE